MLAKPEASVNLGYVPRKQFITFHQRKQRYACLVCHRRAGKTVACIYDLIDACIRATTRSPRFAYIAPYRNQAKDVAWDYLVTGSLPLEHLGIEINKAELRVDYPNGGRIRIYGADDPNALRGLYFDGVVLDEFADMDPNILQVLRPTLADRGGWIVYIGTPRGHNKFYEIWNESTKEPERWFSLMLKLSETGILSKGELAEQSRDLTKEQIEQEFECSFEAAILGAYYGRQMAEAEAGKRITGVPHDREARVWTAWDIGFRDATAVWFFQIVGKEVHLIDYHESTNQDLGEDVKAVLNRTSYNFAGHVLPHDAFAVAKQTGKSDAERAGELGLANVQRCPTHRIHEGISAGQLLMSRCWFNKSKCERGIEALKQYRSRYDEKRKTFSEEPVHDWASHAADSYRYLAVALNSIDIMDDFHKPIKYPNKGRKLV